MRSETPLYRDPTNQTFYDIFTEYALIIKSICDHYNIRQEDLCKLGYMSYSKHVRRIKQVPFILPVSEAFSSKMDGCGSMSYIDATCLRTPTNHDVGIYEYEGVVRDKKIRFWRACSLGDTAIFGHSFHIVERKNLRSLYRIMIQTKKQKIEVKAPILPKGILEDIWRNSIGFLENSFVNQEKYKEFGIPCKRGVLLSGRPGSGKTLSCKWIRQLCQDRNITYRVVTMEDYRKAYSNGNVSRLFEGDRHSKKCVIFFDDMDVMFQDREKGNVYLTEFLTNLDGIDPREGVVYIFTSNRIEDLDSAFIRPGRVDLFLIFDAPDKELRRRFIIERFHKSILDIIDIDDIIHRTEKSEQEDADFPYTFAELDEIRKLLSIEFINRGTVNVEKTFKLFEKHRKEFNERASRMGFASMSSTGAGPHTLDYDFDDDDGSDYYRGFPGFPHMH